MCVKILNFSRCIYFLLTFFWVDQHINFFSTNLRPRSLFHVYHICLSHFQGCHTSKNFGNFPFVIKNPALSWNLLKMMAININFTWFIGIKRKIFMRFRHAPWHKCCNPKNLNKDEKLNWSQGGTCMYQNKAFPSTQRFRPPRFHPLSPTICGMLRDCISYNRVLVTIIVEDNE